MPGRWTRRDRASISPRDLNGLASGFQAHHPVVEQPSCRVSTVVVQRFCKPKVGGSNPSPGIGAIALIFLGDFPSVSILRPSDAICSKQDIDWTFAPHWLWRQPYFRSRRSVHGGPGISRTSRTVVGARDVSLSGAGSTALRAGTVAGRRSSAGTQRPASGSLVSPRHRIDSGHSVSIGGVSAPMPMQRGRPDPDLSCGVATLSPTATNPRHPAGAGVCRSSNAILAELRVAFEHPEVLGNQSPRGDRSGKERPFISDHVMATAPAALRAPQQNGRPPAGCVAIER